MKAITTIFESILSTREQHPDLDPGRRSHRVAPAGSAVELGRLTRSARS